MRRFVLVLLAATSAFGINDLILTVRDRAAPMRFAADDLRLDHLSVRTWATLEGSIDPDCLSHLNEKAPNCGPHHCLGAGLSVEPSVECVLVPLHRDTSGMPLVILELPPEARIDPGAREFTGMVRYPGVWAAVARLIAGYDAKKPLRLSTTQRPPSPLYSLVLTIVPAVFLLRYRRALTKPGLAPWDLRLIVAALFLAGNAIALRVVRDPIMGDSLFIVITATFFGSLGLVRAVTRGGGIAQFDEGVAFRDGLESREVAIPWEALESVEFSALGGWLRLGAGGAQFELTDLGANGSLSVVANALEHRIHDQLWPDYEAKAVAGQSLSFGVIALAGGHLTVNGKRPFGGEEVTLRHLYETWLVIRGKRPWQIRLVNRSALRNTRLLVALWSRLKGSARGS